MSDYTELVQRLREQYMDTKQMLPNVLCHDSADAITALQARVAELEPYVSGARCPNCDNLRLENGELRQDLAAARALLKRQPPSDCRPCHECGAIWWSDEHGCWFIGGQRERTALAGKDAP